MKKYDTKVINCYEKKFEWQSSILEYMFPFIYGLIIVISRTSSGKSRMPLINLHYDSQNYESTVVTVPCEHDTLVKQHEEELIDFCKKNKLICKRKKKGLYLISGYLNGCKIKSYMYEIKPFVSNQKSINDFIKDNSKNVIYIDEIDTIQTQFGLMHSGNKYHHSLSFIKTTFRAYMKEKKEGNDLFKNIIKLTEKNKVVFTSATSDDMMQTDLSPYIGIIPMRYIIVKHTEESFPNIKIEFNDKYESLVDELVKAYVHGEKSYCFVTNKIEQERLNKRLLNKGIEESYIYSWNCSRKGKKYAFCPEKAKKSRIGIFIKKASTGMNDINLDKIFIFRPLDPGTTSSRDKESFKIKDISNLFVQISGRIRKSIGTIYCLHNEQKSTTLFELTDQEFEYLLSYKSVKNHNFMKQINTRSHGFSFFDFHLRNFVFQYIVQKYWIKTCNFFDKLDKDNDTILNGIRTLFKNRCEQMCIDIENDKFDYNEYWKLEEDIMNFYYKFITSKYDACDTYTETIEDDSDDDDDIPFCTPQSSPVKNNERVSENNTTGGGRSKINISETEKAKAKKYLEKAIKNAGCKGKSLMFEYDINYDKPYGEMFMHSKAKRDLKDSERSKSKYAFPMTIDATESGINLNEDIDNPLFPWISSKITVNYDELVQYAGRASIFLRPQKDIERILHFYNSFHNIEV